MRVKEYASFRHLQVALEPDQFPRFQYAHQYEEGKPKEEVTLPKYLFRGEPGLFTSSQPAVTRMLGDDHLTDTDKGLIVRLLELNLSVWGSRTDMGHASLAWAQHYGVPTMYLDVSTNPLVACHFAAGSSDAHQSKHRTFFRIDLEGILEDKIPLGIVYIGRDFCPRGLRQEAWGISCSREDFARGLDLQSGPMSNYVEKFIVGATDAQDYVVNGLIDDRYDYYAPWPYSILRGFKNMLKEPLPRSLVEWLCDRMPRYDWVPCDVHYDMFGFGTPTFRSPIKAKKEDGVDYSISRDEMVTNLTSDSFDMPNPVIFAILRGRPNSTQRIGPGCSFDVFHWMPGFHNVV